MKQEDDGEIEGEKRGDTTRVRKKKKQDRSRERGWERHEAETKDGI